MNEEIKQKWVAALRSGEYEQGTEFLNRDDTFCCLGVLCDVIAKENENIFWADGDITDGTENEGEVLPVFIQKIAGLNKKEPYIKYKDGFTRLTALNDGFADGSFRGEEMFTFDELADLIEEQL